MLELANQHWDEIYRMQEPFVHPTDTDRMDARPFAHVTDSPQRLVFRSPAGPPKLLVSLRSRAEWDLLWEEAVRDPMALFPAWIDLKEPANGSLGCPTAENLQAFTQRTYQWQTAGLPVACSAALGELAEWYPTNTVSAPPTTPPRSAVERQKILQAIAGLQIVKIGLAGEADRSDWQDRFHQFRQEIQATHSTSCPRLIPAVYADATLAHAPSWQQVLTWAKHERPPILLLDTWSKSKRWCDWLGPTEQHEFITQCHQNDIRVALAGKLAWTDLDQLQPPYPDLLAVRSAICHDGDRQQPIDWSRIQQWLQRLQTLSKDQYDKH